MTRKAQPAPDAAVARYRQGAADLRYQVEDLGAGRTGPRRLGGFPRSPAAPAWSLNLLANHVAEILVGERRMQVRASKASGHECERLIDLMDRRYHGFEACRARTDRELSILLLAPRKPLSFASQPARSSSVANQSGCRTDSRPG
jgi:hypothetical protein